MVVADVALRRRARTGRGMWVAAPPASPIEPIAVISAAAMSSPAAVASAATDNPRGSGEAVPQSMPLSSSFDAVSRSRSPNWAVMFTRGVAEADSLDSRTMPASWQTADYRRRRRRGRGPGCPRPRRARPGDRAGGGERDRAAGVGYGVQERSWNGAPEVSMLSTWATGRRGSGPWNEPVVGRWRAGWSWRLGLSV